MKLQELLTSLKSKMPFTYEHSFEVSYDEWIAIIYSYDINWCPSYFMPLAQLLFSTPFLSLLERTDDINPGNWRSHWQASYQDWLVCYNESTSEYHKINLVLLNTDAERISYIENNTI